MSPFPSPSLPSHHNLAGSENYGNRQASATDGDHGGLNEHDIEANNEPTASGTFGQWGYKSAANLSMTVESYVYQYVQGTGVHNEYAGEVIDPPRVNLAIVDESISGHTHPTVYLDLRRC